MNTQQQQFNTEVMRRIRTVYFLKKITQPVIREVVLFIILFALSAFFVSYQNIFENLFSVIAHGNLSNYFVSAFLNTQVVVKVICVASMCVVVLFVWNLFRKLSFVKYV
jgi:hypothetical protein